MTTTVTHFGGHIFMTPEGIVDAYRLLQEIDRLRYQCELLRQGRSDLSLCMSRKPVKHIEGTKLLDTQTGEVFDIRDKQGYLVALQAEVQQLRFDLSLQYLGHRESLTTAHQVVQQIQDLHGQLDGLLEMPAKQICARINSATKLEIAELERAITAFPNDGYYRTELRTVLLKRRQELDGQIQPV
ncbi:hypothetical protein V8Z74_14570 [Comamonas sp. w2-DMI]|uniref:hypothetical protein n=1 Tax=Comamonas sp. w2-DMI TaxID=3126391 RepID=UPI0032E3B5C2